MLPVAILAGGLATRLRPLTETIPKALVEVAGEPFIYHQLQALRDQGIRRVTLCIGYRGEMIQEVIGDGSRFGLAVSYVSDWPNLLGTGGAIKQALPLLDTDFFILYGDSYLPIDFVAVEAAYWASGKPALMTVLANADRWDKSNVLFRDGQLIEYNKEQPRPETAHIDYGLSILNARALRGWQEGVRFDLAELYGRLSQSGELAGLEVFERFYEIGSPYGLAETENYLAAISSSQCKRPVRSQR